MNINLKNCNNFHYRVKYLWRERTNDVVNKIKEGIDIKNDLFVVLIIILVGISGFGLGKLSALEKGREMVQIKPLDLAATTLDSSQASINNINNNPSVIPAQVGIQSSSQGDIKGLVLAAKTGTKYYYPWCSGASRISEKNKVWFDTIQEAKNAGYSAASNCAGLK